MCGVTDRYIVVGLSPTARTPCICPASADAHLAGAQLALAAVDLELGYAVEHQEDLMAEVVGVRASGTAGLDPQEPRPDLPA